MAMSQLATVEDLLKEVCTERIRQTQRGVWWHEVRSSQLSFCSPKGVA